MNLLCLLWPDGGRKLLKCMGNSCVVVVVSSSVLVDNFLEVVFVAVVVVVVVVDGVNGLLNQEKVDES